MYSSSLFCGALGLASGNSEYIGSNGLCLETVFNALVKLTNTCQPLIPPNQGTPKCPAQCSFPTVFLFRPIQDTQHSA